MLDDSTLLRRYCAEREEEAFADFVARHLPLVYSAALRRLGGDTHRAQDVAQVVFCHVARDARRLSRHPELTGWLYTATRNAAVDIVRSEQRRRGREQEAHNMEITAPETDVPADWSRLKPVLDAAMDELPDSDREAVLLRFFQSRPFADIGARLGLSEDAARKRVDRALDKLRTLLQQRRIASTSAALAALLSAETVSAAPAQLTSSVTGTALAVGRTSVGTVSALSLSKLQITVAALVVAGGAVGFAIQRSTIAALRTETNALAKRLAEERETASPSHPRSGSAAAGATLGALEGNAIDASGSPSNTVASLLGLDTGAGTGSRGSDPANKYLKTSSKSPAALAQERARMHQRYDRFFQRHGLSPEKAERFIDLKLAIFEAQDDLQKAMRQAGAQGGTSESESIRNQLVGPLWAEIRELLGPEANKAYPAFEASSAIHSGYIEPMLPEFAAAKVPLTGEQMEQLVPVFARNKTLTRANRSDIHMTGGMDWDTVVTESARVLSAEQVTVLRAHANRRAAASR